MGPHRHVHLVSLRALRGHSLGAAQRALLHHAAPGVGAPWKSKRSAHLLLRSSFPRIGQFQTGPFNADPQLGLAIGARASGSGAASTGAGARGTAARRGSGASRRSNCCPASSTIPPSSAPRQRSSPLPNRGSEIRAAQKEARAPADAPPRQHPPTPALHPRACQKRPAPARGTSSRRA